MCGIACVIDVHGGLDEATLHVFVQIFELLRQRARHFFIKAALQTADDIDRLAYRHRLARDIAALQCALGFRNALQTTLHQHLDQLVRRGTFRSGGSIDLLILR